LRPRGRSANRELPRLRGPARSIEGGVAGATVAEEPTTVGGPHARDLVLVDGPAPVTDGASDALDGMEGRRQLGLVGDASHRAGLLFFLRIAIPIHLGFGSGTISIPSACSTAKRKERRRSTPGAVLRWKGDAAGASRDIALRFAQAVSWESACAGPREHRGIAVFPGGGPTVYCYAP